METLWQRIAQEAYFGCVLLLGVVGALRLRYGGLTDQLIVPCKETAAGMASIAAKLNGAGLLTRYCAAPAQAVADSRS